MKTTTVRGHTFNVSWEVPLLAMALAVNAAANLPPGLETREQLPPGLQNRDQLPPGLDKRGPTGNPPTILHQPLSQSVILYQQAAYGVIASGTPPLQYQWLKDGAPISGATNDQLVIRQTQFSDEGLYSVIVSHAEGSAISTNAALTIKLPRAGDLDGSFVSGGLIDGAVRAIAVQADGRLLIGGEFTTVHGAVRQGIARLNPDGTTDHTFLNGLPGTDGPVYSIVLLDEGKILIGGRFTAVNGEARRNIAWLNRDGSLSGDFEATFAGSQPIDVYTLAVQRDGKVLVGGRFSYVNGEPRSHIVRLNADGSPDPTFHVPQMISGGEVRAITIQNDAKLIVAGDWSWIGSAGHRVVTRLNPDGTPDNTFHEPVSGTIHSVAIQPDGKLVIGGSFRIVNGENRNGLARLNSDGSLDGTFKPVLPLVANADFTWVHSVVLQEDGKIVIAGGSIWTPCCSPTVQNRFVTRFTAAGGRDTGFSPDVDDTVNTLALLGDGRIVVGGSFVSIRGHTRVRLAILNSNGQPDSSFKTEAAGANSLIRSMILQDNGRLLVAGPELRQLNGQPRSGVGRLNPDGTLDAFNPDIFGKDYRVWAVAAEEDGKVWVGGQNMLVTSDRLERFPFGKSLISFGQHSSYGVGTNRFGPVTVIVTQPQFLFGGYGSVGDWPALPTNRSINAITFQSDKILVAGSLRDLGSFVRLRPDRTLDLSFQSTVSGGSVNSLAVQPDQKILVGGDFNIVGEISRRKFARLNSDGSFDPSFQPDLPGPLITVSAIGVQNNGTILVGGNVWPTSGPEKFFIRLYPDGSSDPYFQSPMSRPNVGESVLCSTVQSDGKLIIGGYFTQIHGIPAAYIARLWGEDFPPVLKSISRTGANVHLTWHSIPNRTYRVQYKESLSAEIWTDLPGDVVATGDTARKTDRAAAGKNQRLYRVVQLP
jgi:uncharacterized delta-60 repeat protein